MNRQQSTIILAVASLSQVYGLNAQATLAKLGLESLSYVTPIKHSTRMDNTQFFQGQFNTHPRGSIFAAGVDMEAGVGLNQSNHYFYNVNEAYIGTSSELAPVTFSSGRKFEDWSLADREFAVGLWEPRYRYDYLTQHSSGLTGGFLSLDEPEFGVTLFGSPVFIPDMGSSVSVSDGKITSDSIWFIPPPEQVVVLDQPTKVRYSLNMPALSDVVLNPSAAALVRVGRKDSFFGKFSYGYKPMNQIFISYTQFLDITKTDPEAAVDIYPRVVYHQVATVEAGYGGKPVGFFISVSSDKPMDETLPSDREVQVVSPSVQLASSMNVRLFQIQEKPTQLKLGYLKNWGSEAKSSESEIQFTPRYDFEQAFKFGIQSGISQVSASTSVLFDLNNQGSIVMAELAYSPVKSWNISFGADVLGVGDEPPARTSENQGFIGEYRANDRIHGGLSYVF